MELPSSPSSRLRASSLGRRRCTSVSSDGGDTLVTTAALKATFQVDDEPPGHYSLWEDNGYASHSNNPAAPLSQIIKNKAAFHHEAIAFRKRLHVALSGNRKVRYPPFNKSQYSIWNRMYGHWVDDGGSFRMSCPTSSSAQSCSSATTRLRALPSSSRPRACGPSSRAGICLCRPPT